MLPYEADERSSSFAEMTLRHVRASLLDLRIAMPVSVVRYDESKQEVDCLPLIRQAYLDESDTRQTETLPIVPHVPVAFPGAGGYRVTFPIPRGSTGLLLCADRSLDRWLASDGTRPIDPEIDHAHALTDGIFLPGLRPTARPLKTAPTDHATMGADAGVQIHMHDRTICIGDESGAQWVALAQNVNDTLSRLQRALEGLFSATAAPILEPGNGAPSQLQAMMKAALANALITGPGATWPDDVSAKQARAK